MLSLWAIGLLGLLNQVEALWSPGSYPSQAQQFSASGWGTSPAAQNPWSFNRPMSNMNAAAGMPNVNAAGMPGGMPAGSMPAGGMPNMNAAGMSAGGMPNMNAAGMSAGGMPNLPAGGMPTSGMSGAMSNMNAGGGPGFMPNRPYNNMMGNMQNGYPPSYMSPARHSICVAPVSQPRLCMVNGENTHKYRLKDVIEFLGHPNIEKVPKCVQGVPRVNCADYYAAQYIWKRGYCYCKNFHSNQASNHLGSTRIRCVLNNCGACSQEFYVDTQRVVRCE